MFLLGGAVGLVGGFFWGGFLVFLFAEGGWGRVVWDVGREGGRKGCGGDVKETKEKGKMC
jgi:hypothetical protein